MSQCSWTSDLIKRHINTGKHAQTCYTENNGHILREHLCWPDGEKKRNFYKMHLYYLFYDLILLNVLKDYFKYMNEKELIEEK